MPSRRRRRRSPVSSRRAARTRIRARSRRSGPTGRPSSPTRRDCRRTPGSSPRRRGPTGTSTRRASRCSVGASRATTASAFRRKESSRRAKPGLAARGSSCFTASLGNALRILAVDDDRLALRMLTALLHAKGHEPIPARDGQEAIERFEGEAPGLVLMDVSMPGRDGHAATAEIKKRCGPRWVPVIFLSSTGEAEQQVRGLEVGGDDYLIKPVNPIILEAKLRAMERIVGIQQAMQRQSEELARYRDEWEREQALANHVMDRLVAVHQLTSDQVRSVCIPAKRFSGDVTALTRRPPRALH